MGGSLVNTCCFSIENVIVEEESSKDNILAADYSFASQGSNSIPEDKEL